jgi:hypothetical protein
MRSPLQEKIMPMGCRKPLRTNPFTVYRDPNTGKWIIIKLSSGRGQHSKPIHQQARIAIK